MQRDRERTETNEYQIRNVKLEKGLRKLTPSVKSRRVEIASRKLQPTKESRASFSYTDDLSSFAISLIAGMLAERLVFNAEDMQSTGAR